MRLAAVAVAASVVSLPDHRSQAHVPPPRLLRAAEALRGWLAPLRWAGLEWGVRLEPSEEVEVEVVVVVVVQPLRAIPDGVRGSLRAAREEQQQQGEEGEAGQGSIVRQKCLPTAAQCSRRAQHGYNGRILKAVATVGEVEAGWWRVARRWHQLVWAPQRPLPPTRPAGMAALWATPRGLTPEQAEGV